MSENNEPVQTSSNLVYTLTFTEEELNKILNIVAQLPYATVFTLINNIQLQAQNQQPVVKN